MITIRKAKPGDEKALLELLAQVLLVHHEIRPDLFLEKGAKHSIEEITEMILDEDNPVFVAIDENDIIVGHCMCAHKHVEAPNAITHDTLHIDDLCIDKDHRKMGIGKLLCDYASSYAKEKGFYNVTLNVWEGNNNAKAFYDSLGFKPYRQSLEFIL